MQMAIKSKARPPVELTNQPNTTLAGRISMARKVMGWNKSRLAREVGVSNATVSDWESGEIKEVKSSYIFILGEKLNINARWLATGEGVPQRMMIHSQDERDFLELYRLLSPASKNAILATAKAFAAQDSPQPTPPRTKP